MDLIIMNRIINIGVLGFGGPKTPKPQNPKTPKPLSISFNRIEKKIIFNTEFTPYVLFLATTSLPTLGPCT